MNSPPASGAFLDVVKSDGCSHRVAVSELPFLIGRSADTGNHLPLTDARISRKCAALVPGPEGLWVEDRGQRHGVFVNGKKIERHLLMPGDVISFGNVDSLSLVFHTEGEISLPSLLSQIEDAAALDPKTRELRHLSLLLEATALLQSHLPLEEVLGAMLDRAVTVTQADRGLLLEVLDDGGVRPRLARLAGGRRIPPAELVPSQTVLSQVLNRQRAVVEEDVDAVPGLREAQSVAALKLRSVAAIPLFGGGSHAQPEEALVTRSARVMGVLYLDSGRLGAFSKIERQILDTLAIEAAAVLEKARLVQKEREQQRLAQELATAREIQQALLPQSNLKLPFLEAAGINESCSEVGGDYYDVMQLEPGRVAFVIADVCGKGLAAALVTATLQGTFSAMALVDDPRRVCAHYNQFACAHSDLQRHATLLFAILHAGGRLDYINAGHLPALRVHNGQVSTALAAESLPIGLFPEAEFHRQTAQLEPGDTLVLFTDGVTEALDPKGEQFGLEGLEEAVRQNAALPPAQMQAGILEAVRSFSGGAPQADDLTLLVLRFTGA